MIDVSPAAEFLDRTNMCSTGCGCENDYFQRSPGWLLDLARQDPELLARALETFRNSLEHPDDQAWVRAWVQADWDKMLSLPLDDDVEFVSWLRSWERLLTAVQAAISGATVVGDRWPGPWLAAIDPDTPPRRLAELAGYVDVNIDIALVEHPATPLEVLLALVDQADFECLRELASRNPQHPEVLRRLVDPDFDEDRFGFAFRSEYLATNRSTPIDVLWAIAQHPDNHDQDGRLNQYLANKLLAHPASTLPLLHHLRARRRG